MKILASQLCFPVSIGKYIIEALQERPDVELKTVGPAWGNQIPWNGGMNVLQKYAFTPDIPLPKNINNIPMSFVENHLNGFQPDVVLQIDAGFHMVGRPTHGYNVQVLTDPHCASGDTFVATSLGIRTLEELAGVSGLKVCDRTGLQPSDEVIFSGYKPLITYELETGQRFSVTADHLIESESGDMVKAETLKLGDKVNLYCGTYSPPAGSSADYSKGFIYGAFQGDGWFGSSDIVKFTLGTEKKTEVGDVIQYHLLMGFGIDTVTRSIHHTCENAFVLQVRRMGLYEQLKKAELKSGHVPLCIRSGTKQFIAGYFAGLLATDGCSVHGHIQITTKHRKLADEWQTVLFYLGVPTKVKYVLSGKTSYKPGQKYATLFVRSGYGQDALNDLCGKIPGRLIGENSRTVQGSSESKQSYAIVAITGNARNSKKKRCAQPVYDVLNTSSGTFLANGVSVHNCLMGFYDQVRPYFDLVWNMQTPYMKPDHEYLMYAYSDKWFYPEDTPKVYDACLIGLHYHQRDRLVDALRAKGLNVYYDIGPAFDEYRQIYNQSKVAISWSSLLDTPMRVYEAMGMRIPLVANRTPDLMNQFKDGLDFKGFDTVDQAVEAVLWFLQNPADADRIATNGYLTATFEYTWRERVGEMIDQLMRRI